MSRIDDVERVATRTNRRRLWLAVALLAALAVGLSMLPLETWLQRALLTVDAHPVASRALFVAAFVVATAAMVPGSLLMLCGGYLFGLLHGLPLASLGVALGSLASAGLSRTLAREWLAARFADDPRFLAIDGAVAGKGFLIVLLSRFSLLMPFNLLNVLYGLTRIPLRTLTLATWLGMTPAIVLYTWLGAAAQDVTALMAGSHGDSRVGTAVLVSGVVVAAGVTLLVHRTASAALKRELSNPGSP